MWPCQIHGSLSVYWLLIAIIGCECYLPRPGAVAVGTFIRNDRPKRTQQWHRAAAPVRNAQTLGYLCDLIHELKHLADRSGQRTLSAILAAALIEARIQNDDNSH